MGSTPIPLILPVTKHFGVDPIRLNHFFDLLSMLSRTRNSETLGSLLGTHLRFVIDFDDCYFILGNPVNLSLCKIYVSTEAAPQAVRANHEDLRSFNFDKILQAYFEGLGAKTDGKIICLPLNVKNDLWGVLILSRLTAFKQSEHHFVEAISGFLAQMLDGFSMTDELTDAHGRTQAGETHQKVLVQELEVERELRERFVSALSHDLRSPLTAAKLASQLLTKKMHDPKMVEMLSLRITASIDRVDRMILDLLDANRIKAGEGIATTFESCHFDEIVTSIVDDLSYIYGPRFRINSPLEPIHGFCDRGAIQRVLENLVTNAVKYGDLKTPITIGVKHEMEWIEISVHNEGNIISESDQNKVFGQYSRTESAIVSGQKGWGIGLSLVRAIAKAHQGSVRVESSAEAGTTFTVRLVLDPREKS